MVSVLALVGTGLLLIVHTAMAAIATRLLRVRLQSWWGPIVYAVVLVPVLLVLSTMLLSGMLGLGTNLGDPGTATFLLVVVPLALGVTVDYVWMPAPGDVELPETV